MEEVVFSRQSVFNTVYSVRCLSCLEGQGKLSRSCPNNISINSHKKHGRWNEKMAETGQEEVRPLPILVPPASSDHTSLSTPITSFQAGITFVALSVSHPEADHVVSVVGLGLYPASLSRPLARRTSCRLAAEVL
ncbi:hypothetical protein NQ317_005612, partial [Molorchus minor]